MLKAVVVGAGNMGKNHVRNYSVLPGVELTGLADVNPNAEALAKEFKCKFFTDYEEMFDAIKPDIVSIVVPTPFHAQVAMNAMNRGIHCLVEKPIASTVAEADQMIACAKKNKVVFTVGHIERYNPLIKKLKKVIDTGKIGDVTSIVCRRVGGFPQMEPKTDVIIDLAVHDIDIVNYILGQRPKKIVSHGSRTHHSQKIDSAEILMDYGRASGFVQANWLTPVKIRTISVTGSQGYVEGNYITQELAYYKHNMQKVKDDFANFVTDMGKLEQEAIAVDFEEPLASELKGFIAAVKGNPEKCLVQADDAKEALRIALDAVEPFNHEGKGK